MPVDVRARYNINQTHANVLDQGALAQFEEKDEIEGLAYDVIEDNNGANINAEGDEQPPKEVEGAQRRYNLR